MTYSSLRPSLTGLGLQALLVAVMSSGVVATGAATYQTQTLPRVRSQNPSIVDAIRQGAERSPTFRRLLETIDATDGLVYVSEGSCRYNVRACLVLSVTISGPFRLLHILVEPRKAVGCDLVASIGHELQHAREVLSDTNVRSTHQIFHFFYRVGRTGSETFETGEAVEMGFAVGREACASR
jgi:hypothetical protein